jgi:hypothetical protein
VPAAGGGAPRAVERWRQRQRWLCRWRQRRWWQLRLLSAYRVAGTWWHGRAGVHSAPAALTTVSFGLPTICNFPNTTLKLK